ncbi:MAG: synthase subunit epsilon [Bacteroidota bacterium]|nr:synthase subunit epsilon [Bacteroidota bacterium]
MQLNILTPELKVFSGEVESVQFPGMEGKFQVLDNHAPMIASIVEGIVKIKSAAGKQEFKVKSGIVEVLKNNVSVLTEGIIQ